MWFVICDFIFCCCRNYASVDFSDEFVTVVIVLGSIVDDDVTQKQAIRLLLCSWVEGSRYLERYGTNYIGEQAVKFDKAKV